VKYYESEIILVPKEPYICRENRYKNVYYIRSLIDYASGGDLTFSVYRYNPRAMDGYKGSFLVYGLDIISKKEDGEFFDWLLKMFPQIIPYFYRGYTHFQKDGTIQEQMMWEYHMDIHKYTRLLKLKRTYNAHEPKV